MKKLLILLFTCNIGLLISQTKQSNTKVDLLVDGVFQKMTLKINSESEALTNCKVQIIDSKNNTVKTVDLPKASNQIEKIIAITDLSVGNYTCLIYNGKKEIYKGEFFKDALDSNPGTALNPKN